MQSVQRLALHSRQGNIGLVAGVALTSIATYGVYSYSTKNFSKTEAPKTFGTGPSFVSLRLNSIELLNHDTKKFRFDLPTTNSVSGLTLTSAVLTFSRPLGRVFPVIRPYTPTSDLNEPGYLDLVVKQYPNGKASSHIHSLQPGDSLFFLAAIKAYPWKLNECSHITLLAGGAGITPMYQLIQGILNNPEEKTKITLVFGINTDADALFRDRFQQYEQEFPDRFKVFYTVTNPGPSSPYRKGRITEPLLRQIIGEHQEKTNKVFVCGPPAMEQSLLGSDRTSGGILGELGFTKDQIFKF
ncbi:oxidoreductase NAD-binding domain-containing protein [Phlyctema vagabunda]|uniref:NADH-cytochrome b5 reductase n=1 Tax=Phlyctema vagabunda TaxID=108571 RepID=A0ABR4P532_9HELO